MVTTNQLLAEGIELVRAAIESGDWEVDGACDPSAWLARAEQAISSASESRAWQIWCEGFSVTGQQDGARLLGTAEGTTFREACKALAARDPEFASYFNAERMSYWGCGLFDNEAQARRRFG
jgi:hypothetical protein